MIFNKYVNGYVTYKDKSDILKHLRQKLYFSYIQIKKKSRFISLLAKAGVCWEGESLFHTLWTSGNWSQTETNSERPLIKRKII